MYALAMGEHIKNIPTTPGYTPSVPIQFCSGEKCVVGCTADKGYCGLSKKG